MVKECSMCHKSVKNSTEYHAACLAENKLRRDNKLCVRCAGNLSRSDIENMAHDKCMFKPFLNYPSGDD